MKNHIIVLLFLLFVSVVGFSQNVVPANPASITVANQREWAVLNMYLPHYTDTIQANLNSGANKYLGIDSSGAVIYCYSTKSLWVRQHSPKKWVEVGSGGSGIGTVTSIATNTGTGITGGTITLTGTLALDTTKVSTRAWRQKGIDSLAALISASGVTSLSAVGSSPNANGATITGSVLNLQPASAAQPGVVNTTTQSFAGNKTFTGNVILDGGTMGIGSAAVAGYSLRIQNSGSYELYFPGLGGATNIYSENTTYLNTDAALTLNMGNGDGATDLSITGNTVRFKEASTPGTPTSGYMYLYPASDNFLYAKNDAAEVFNLTQGGRPLAVALADGATISVDASLGNTITATYKVTLGGNRTIANPTGLTNGQTIVFELVQDGTGNRTVTWDTKYIFSTDTPAPTLSTAAAAVDLVGFVYDSGADKLYAKGVNTGH